MKPLIFKDIKQDLYFIEENGDIYSKSKQRYLKPQKDKNGYLQINLQRPEGGRGNRICKRIATLVAYTYIGPPPEDMLDPTINHIDGNKTNNHYTNLEWIERGINSSIRENKGIGIDNHEARLTQNDVYEICKLLTTTNLTCEEIANKYGVKKSTIINILHKKNWKNIANQFDFSSRKLIRNEQGRYEVINLSFQGE